MKEMENNNFIHTLDAVYNLCSEIKELVNVETEKQEDEGSEGIVLLSDNLQRLQSEITEMKTELSSDREGRERLRAVKRSQRSIFGSEYNLRKNICRARTNQQ